MEIAHLNSASRQAARLAAALLCCATISGFAAPHPASSASPASPEAVIRNMDGVIERGSFKPEWNSLRRYQIPAWYEDAKFGIFIHWGLYSVPAFRNEWYSRNMYRQGTPEFQHHLETYGPHARFGYKDFIPRFKGERFNAEEWATLFRRAGARYVVPVAEHHDGFAMHDTAFSKWDAVEMGPRRDVIGELSRAVRRQGMHFGVSYHRAENWWFFDGGMQFDSDVRDERYRDFYGPARSDQTQPDTRFLTDWLARAGELVEKYQPDVFYFDWWIKQPSFQPHLQKFAAYYYDRAAEWKKGVALTYKEEAMPEGTAVLDVERGQLGELRTPYWQTDTSSSWKSWCYIEGDEYRSAESIVQLLVDVVSKNGGVLLNVGPKADGTFPAETRRMLEQVGKWLEINGEAIYGSRPWTQFGEGPTRVETGSKTEAANPFTAEDIRFTRQGNVLYAIQMAPSRDGRVTIRSLARGGALSREITNVERLGGERKVEWQQTSAGLSVKSTPLVGGFPVVYRIRLEAKQQGSRVFGRGCFIDPHTASL